MIRRARSSGRPATAALAVALIALCAACGGADSVGGLPTFTPRAGSTAARIAAPSTSAPAVSDATGAAAAETQTAAAEAAVDRAAVERVYLAYMAAKVTLGASGRVDPTILRPWATEQLATSDAEAMGLLFKAHRRMLGTIEAQVRSVTFTQEGATLIACNDSSAWEAFTVKAGRTEGPDMEYRNSPAVSEAKLVREGDTWRMDDYYPVAPTC